MEKKVLLLMVILLSLAATDLWAGGAQGFIEEISIKNYDAEYDIHVRIKWTGDGDKEITSGNDRGEWMEIRHGELGHRGVDRAYTLLLAAFALHKTCWFAYDNGTTRITGVYLKNTF